MPELPDVTVYIERLAALTSGQVLDKIRLKSPFVVRTFDPRIAEAHGKRVHGFRRLGKRIIFCLDGDLFLVLHLMVAGRLRWRKLGAKPGTNGLACFDFPGAGGTLLFTEASKKKRASIHLVRGEAALESFDRGGIDVLDGDPAAFREALFRENHTLKRSLTDQHLFSGIGNAYSDEILHHAKLSPVKWSTRLTEDEVARLYESTQTVLGWWIDKTREEVGEGFPDKVTAFRPEMAVHGKFKQPCPACQTPVQRIVYAENETNYCPTCQTGGKLLADRALSQLLKKDWPKTLEELEERKRSR